MNPRSHWKLFDVHHRMRPAIILMIGVAAAIAGCTIGSTVGLLVGVAIDNAAPNEVFVSAVLGTIPLFGFIGMIVGAVVGARLVGHPPKSN